MRGSKQHAKGTRRRAPYVVDAQVSAQTMERAVFAMRRSQFIAPSSESTVSATHDNPFASNYGEFDDDGDDQEPLPTASSMNVTLPVAELLLRYPGTPLHEEATGCTTTPIPSTIHSDAMSPVDQTLVINVADAYMEERKRAYTTTNSSSLDTSDSVHEMPLPLVRQWERWCAATMRIVISAVDARFIEGNTSIVVAKARRLQEQLGEAMSDLLNSIGNNVVGRSVSREEAHLNLFYQQCASIVAEVTESGVIEGATKPSCMLSINGLGNDADSDAADSPDSFDNAAIHNEIARRIERLELLSHMEVQISLGIAQMLCLLPDSNDSVPGLARAFATQRASTLRDACMGGNAAAELASPQYSRPSLLAEAVRIATEQPPNPFPEGCTPPLAREFLHPEEQEELASLQSRAMPQHVHDSVSYRVTSLEGTPLNQAVVNVRDPHSGLYLRQSKKIAPGAPHVIGGIEQYRNTLKDDDDAPADVLASPAATNSTSPPPALAVATRNLWKVHQSNPASKFPSTRVLAEATAKFHQKHANMRTSYLNVNDEDERVGLSSKEQADRPPLTQLDTVHRRQRHEHPTVDTAANVELEIESHNCSSTVTTLKEERALRRFISSVALGSEFCETSSLTHQGSGDHHVALKAADVGRAFVTELASSAAGLATRRFNRQCVAHESVRSAFSSRHAQRRATGLSGQERNAMSIVDLMAAARASNALIALATAEEYYDARRYLPGHGKGSVGATSNQNLKGMLSVLLSVVRKQTPSISDDPLFSRVIAALGPRDVEAHLFVGHVPQVTNASGMCQKAKHQQAPSDPEGIACTTAALSNFVWGTNVGWLPLNDVSVTVLQEVKDPSQRKYIQSVYLRYEYNCTLRQAALTRLAYARKARRDFLQTQFYRLHIKSLAKERNVDTAAATTTSSTSASGSLSFRAIFQEGNRSRESSAVASNNVSLSRDRSRFSTSVRSGVGFETGWNEMSMGNAQEDRPLCDDDHLRDYMETVAPTINLPINITRLPLLNDRDLNGLLSPEDIDVLNLTSEFTAKQRDEVIDAAVSIYKESLLGFRLSASTADVSHNGDGNSTSAIEELDLLAAYGERAEGHVSHSARKASVLNSVDERLRFSSASGLTTSSLFSRNFYPKTILPGISFRRDSKCAECAVPPLTLSHNPFDYQLRCAVAAASSREERIQPSHEPTMTLYDSIVSSQGIDKTFESWRNEISAIEREMARVNVGSKRGREVNDEDGGCNGAVVRHQAGPLAGIRRSWVLLFHVGFGTTFEENGKAARAFFHGAEVECGSAATPRSVLVAWASSQHVVVSAAPFYYHLPNFEQRRSLLFDPNLIPPPLGLVVSHSPLVGPCFNFDVHYLRLYRLQRGEEDQKPEMHPNESAAIAETEARSVAFKDPDTLDASEKRERTNLRLTLLAHAARFAGTPPFYTASKTQYKTTFNVYTSSDVPSSRSKLLFFHVSQYGSSGNELLTTATRPFQSSLPAGTIVNNNAVPLVKVDLDSSVFKTVDVDGSTFEAWARMYHLADPLKEEQRKCNDNHSPTTITQRDDEAQLLSSLSSMMPVAPTVVAAHKAWRGITGGVSEESQCEEDTVGLPIRGGAAHGDRYMVAAPLHSPDLITQKLRWEIQGFRLDPVGWRLRFLASSLLRDAANVFQMSAEDLLSAVRSLKDYAPQSAESVDEETLEAVENLIPLPRHALATTSSGEVLQNYYTHHLNPLPLQSDAVRKLSYLYKKRIAEEHKDLSNLMRGKMTLVARSLKVALRRDTEDMEVISDYGPAVREMIEIAIREIFSSHSKESKETFLRDLGTTLPDKKGNLVEHHKQRISVMKQMEHEERFNSSVQLIDTSKADVYVRQQVPLGNLTLRYMRCFAPRHMRYFLPSREHSECSFAIEHLQERRVALLVRKLAHALREYTAACAFAEKLTYLGRGYGNGWDTLRSFVEGVSSKEYIAQLAHATQTGRASTIAAEGIYNNGNGKSESLNNIINLVDSDDDANLPDGARCTTSPPCVIDVDQMSSITEDEDLNDDDTEESGKRGQGNPSPLHGASTIIKPATAHYDLLLQGLLYRPFSDDVVQELEHLKTESAVPENLIETQTLALMAESLKQLRTGLVTNLDPSAARFVGRKCALSLHPLSSPKASDFIEFLQASFGREVLAVKDCFKTVSRAVLPLTEVTRELHSHLKTNRNALSGLIRKEYDEQEAIILAKAPKDGDDESPSHVRTLLQTLSTSLLDIHAQGDKPHFSSEKRSLVWQAQSFAKDSLVLSDVLEVCSRDPLTVEVARQSEDEDNRGDVQNVEDEGKCNRVALQEFLLESANPFLRATGPRRADLRRLAPVGSDVGASTRTVDRKYIFLLTAEIRRALFPSRPSTKPLAAHITANGEQLMKEHVHELSKRYLREILRRHEAVVNLHHHQQSQLMGQVESMLPTKLNSRTAPNWAHATAHENLGKWIDAVGHEPEDGTEAANDTAMDTVLNICPLDPDELRAYYEHRAAYETEGIFSAAPAEEGDDKILQGIDLNDLGRHPPEPPKSTASVPSLEKAFKVLNSLLASFHSVRETFLKMLQLHRQFSTYFGFLLVSEEADLIPLLTHAYEELVAAVTNTTVEALVVNSVSTNPDVEHRWLKLTNTLLIALLSQFPVSMCPRADPNRKEEAHIKRNEKIDLGQRWSRTVVGSVQESLVCSGNEHLMEALLRHWTFVTTKITKKQQTKSGFRALLDRGRDGSGNVISASIDELQKTLRHTALEKLQPVLFPVPELLAHLLVVHGDCSEAEAERLARVALQMD